MTYALLALWGALVTLLADSLPDTKVSLLPPVNLTIQVIDVAQVLLHWAPNPAQEAGGAELGYHVRVRTPLLQDAEEFKIKETERRYQVTLHRGLSACVCTVLWAASTSWPTSHWVAADLDAPPGAPGSSAVNLTCSTRVWANRDLRPGLSPLHVALWCSWQVGRDSPAGLQYFLHYRYFDTTQECPSYERDALGRNVGCREHRTAIKPKARGKLAVRVSGASPRVAVRPWEQLFDLAAIDRVNPPRNLTAMVDGHHLSVRWEKPLSAFTQHCFSYEVQVLSPRTGRLQTERLQAETFTALTDGTSQFSVRVRATMRADCRSGGSWGPWSQPVLAGRDEVPAPGEWLPVAAVAVAGLCLLAFSLLCRLSPLWAKVLPPIPAPKGSVAEFLMATSKEAEAGEPAGTGAEAQEGEAEGGEQEPGPETLGHSGL